MAETADMDSVYLSLDEIHSEEMAILQNFKTFCEGHSLRFSLSGGTLLGAVRHRGFIPWDDDIDVSMPRTDWVRLVALRDKFNKETGNFLRPYIGADFSNTPFLKICSSEIAVQSEKERVTSNLWIDVIPMDGLPDDQDKVGHIYKQAHFLRSLIFVATETAESGRNSWRRAAKQLLGPILRVPYVSSAIYRSLDVLARTYSYGSTKYVGAITWGLYGAGEVVPVEQCERIEYLEFEGARMPCMACWDSYLTGIYGDYMKLPPIEKRHIHGLKAWRVGGEI